MLHFYENLHHRIDIPSLFGAESADNRESDFLNILNFTKVIKKTDGECDELPGAFTWRIGFKFWMLKIPINTVAFHYQAFGLTQSAGITAMISVVPRLVRINLLRSARCSVAALSVPRVRYSAGRHTRRYTSKRWNGLIMMPSNYMTGPNGCTVTHQPAAAQESISRIFKVLLIVPPFASIDRQKRNQLPVCLKAHCLCRPNLRLPIRHTHRQVLTLNNWKERDKDLNHKNLKIYLYRQ